MIGCAFDGVCKEERDGGKAFFPMMDRYGGKRGYKYMKTRRHAMILQLVDTLKIETQEALAEELMLRGMRVTQATISRDIKELRLVKVLSEDGVYRYASSDISENAVNERMLRLFSESVISIIEAESMIVIKTLTASAQVAAEAVDSLGWHEIAGTLAGDNTIFVAIRKKEQVSGVANRFRAMVRVDNESSVSDDE